MSPKLTQLVARAWRDEEYLESLTEQEKLLVPKNPAGHLRLATEAPHDPDHVKVYNTNTTNISGCCGTFINNTCSTMITDCCSGTMINNTCSTMITDCCSTSHDGGC